MINKDTLKTIGCALSLLAGSIGLLFIPKIMNAQPSTYILNTTIIVADIICNEHDGVYGIEIIGDNEGDEYRVDCDDGVAFPFQDQQ